VRSSRAIFLLWSLVLIALVVLELAELTHLFTFPITAVIGDPLSLVVSLVFTTIVAMIGAIFVGIYISSRLLGPRGFTPFEEEMLRMREELHELRRSVDDLRVRRPPEPPAEGPRR
jgi:hypothetical protein